VPSSVFSAKACGWHTVPVLFPVCEVRRPRTCARLLVFLDELLSLLRGHADS